jgi:hypothetical protein
MRDTGLAKNRDLAPVRIGRWFYISAGVILAMTGVAKLVSTTGDASILRVYDPIFALPFKQLLMPVGMVEIGVAGLCFARLPGHARTAPLVAALLAGLASGFLFYRASIWMIGWKRPCGCLGHITDVLGIPPEAADRIALALLIYLLVGSYGLLLCQLRSRSARNAAPPNVAPCVQW